MKRHAHSFSLAFHPAFIFYSSNQAINISEISGVNIGEKLPILKEPKQVACGGKNFFSLISIDHVYL